jgi:hypothetical protein
MTQLVNATKKNMPGTGSGEKIRVQGKNATGGLRILVGLN